MMWFFDTNIYGAKVSTFFHIKRERTKKTYLIFEKRRKAERRREEVYIYISLEHI